MGWIHIRAGQFRSDGIADGCYEYLGSSYRASSIHFLASRISYPAFGGVYNAVTKNSLEMRRKK
jgi:hypothetical protein